MRLNKFSINRTFLISVELYHKFLQYSKTYPNIYISIMYSSQNIQAYSEKTDRFIEEDSLIVPLGDSKLHISGDLASSDLVLIKDGILYKLVDKETGTPFKVLEELL